MVAPGPADQLRAGPGLNAIRAATGEEARLIAAPQRAQRTRRKAQGLSGAVDTAGSCTTQKAWTLLGYARNRASGNSPSPANQQPCNPAGPEWAFSMRSAPSAGQPGGLGAPAREGTGAAWGDRFAGARADRGRAAPAPCQLRFIWSKNSELVLDDCMRPSRNSMASMSSMPCRNLRRIQSFCNSSGAVSSSSRRVPERFTLIAG